MSEDIGSGSEVYEEGVLVAWIPPNSSNRIGHGIISANVGIVQLLQYDSKNLYVGIKVKFTLMKSIKNSNKLSTKNCIPVIEVTQTWL